MGQEQGNSTPLTRTVSMQPFVCMANYKRQGPKSTRAGCLMCKPHKHQAEHRRDRTRACRMSRRWRSRRHRRSMASCGSRSRGGLRVRPAVTLHRSGNSPLPILVR